MKFISAVTSVQYNTNSPSVTSHGSHTGHTSNTMVASTGILPGPSRLPQKRETRIPGPGTSSGSRQAAPSSSCHTSNSSGNPSNSNSNGHSSLGHSTATQSNGLRKVRVPIVGNSTPLTHSGVSSVKSFMSDVSRRSSSPANGNGSSNISRGQPSSGIPGAPEIGIRSSSKSTNYSSPNTRLGIRPPRPTSIPSAPHPCVSTSSSIPPGHFSAAKISQPVTSGNTKSATNRNNSTNSSNVSTNNNSTVSNSSSLAKVVHQSEINGRKDQTRENEVGHKGAQNESSKVSNPSSHSSGSNATSTSSSSATSPLSSLSTSSPSSSTTSSPPAIHQAGLNGDPDHNPSFNHHSHPSPSPVNEFRTNNNDLECNKSQTLASHFGPTSAPPPVQRPFVSGVSSMPSSPAKICPSGNFLSRTVSQAQHGSPYHSATMGHQPLPVHFPVSGHLNHNYHQMKPNDDMNSFYSDSECSRNKSKANILYSYSPSNGRNNFPAISEIAGVIESSSNLGNSVHLANCSNKAANSNLMENNSLLAKCNNKVMNQLDSGTRREPLTPVTPLGLLNNSLRSSPVSQILELESGSSCIGNKCPSLRNLSGSSSILTSTLPTMANNLSSQAAFRRLSKNSDLRGSAASLLSASSNFSSAEEKQGNEIKKLRCELLRANDKIATLTNQLITSSQMVTAFEQSLSSTITRLQQVTVASEGKDREIGRLKSTIDSLRKQIDNSLPRQLAGSMDGINGQVHSDMECGKRGKSDSIKRQLKLRSLSKDRGDESPGWLRGSITRAFRKSRPRTKSGNDSGSDADSVSSRTNLAVIDQGFRSMPGTPIHSPRVAANSIDETEEVTCNEQVIDLKSKLQEKEKVLTDIRLEALSVAHQMDGLKDSNSRLKAEIDSLKSENRRLHRMVRRTSITSSVGSLASFVDSSLNFEGKENNLDKSTPALDVHKSSKSFSSDSDLDPLLNALMKLRDATGTN